MQGCLKKVHKPRYFCELENVLIYYKCLHDLLGCRFNSRIPLHKRTNERTNKRTFSSLLESEWSKRPDNANVVFEKDQTKSRTASPNADVLKGQLLAQTGGVWEIMLPKNLTKMHFETQFVRFGAYVFSESFSENPLFISNKILTIYVYFSQLSCLTPLLEQI